MSARAPIGVFDSGVGGLSVLRAIRDELPRENLLYVADSANAPYGDRDEAFVVARSAAIARFLLGCGVRAIVVACNTATVVAVQSLREWCPVPVIAIEPAIKPAAQRTKTGVIGVLATTRTVQSASVARLRQAHATHVEVRLVACPGLVEQVERGELATQATRALLAGYVKPLLDAGADAIVLGCTHYPFLGGLLRELCGPDVALIDPAAAVARELARRIGPAPEPAADEALGTESFFTSGASEAGAAIVSMLWGRPVVVQRMPEEG